MRRLYALILVFPALLAACDALPRSSRPDEDEMIASEEFAVPGREVLWEMVKIEVERSGYRIDTHASDPVEGTFETHWVEDLAPHRFEGARQKMLGVIVPSEDRPGTYRVLATTWVQKNADMKDPMDTKRAIWQDAEPDDGVTRDFLYRLRLRLDPSDS